MKESRGNEPSMPAIEVKGAKVNLPLIDEAERLANEPRKSDVELAHDYAQMIDNIYMDAAELDPSVCSPDRRFYRSGREAWVYDHGNICELIFVR